MLAIFLASLVATIPASQGDYEPTAGLSPRGAILGLGPTLSASPRALRAHGGPPVTEQRCSYWSQGCVR